MSLELKKESIKTGKKLSASSSEQRIDMDITLPDYCADIKKILRCTFIPGIHTVSVSGERVSAKGTGTVRVLYLTDNDKAEVFEKSCDLSATVQSNEITADTVADASSVVDFVNCRAVSQRKITLSASISTRFCFYGIAEESIAINGEEKNIQVKKEKLTCESHLGFFDKTFDLSETVVLNGDHPPMGRIVSTDCRCINQSHKLSGGKLLIKGDVVTDVCYIPENTENKFHFFSHSMPVSQIVDVREVPDSASCDIVLKVCQQLCNIKADSSGSNRLMDVSLRVNAFVRAKEKKECDVITDCYCVDYETEEKFEKAELLCPVREINEMRQAKGETEFSSPVKEICFSRCLEISKAVKYTENSVDFDCTALVFIMYLDENSVPCCCEKNLDFSFSYSIVKKCTEPFGSFDVDAMAVSLMPGAPEKAEITLDYRVCGKVFSRFEKKILKELCVRDDKPKAKSGAALSIYFTDEGERLWDIARSHNTTVELIEQENGLKDETVNEKMMLLIPCI